MQQLVYLFLTFIICSMLGYVIEVLWIFWRTKKLVNRGFLCGPLIPVYGLGAVLIIYSLFRYYEDPVVVFVFGVIITSCLEYFTSFILEKMFHNRWWDYSNLKYNLNGRICLKNSLLFGVLSLVIVYFIAPLLFMLFELLSFKTWLIIAIVIFVIFVADVIYSVIIAYNLRHRIIVVEELKKQKLAMIPVLLEKQIKDSLDNLKAFPSRLLKAFPYIEVQNHNFFEAMRNVREKSKKKKKKTAKK